MNHSDSPHAGTAATLPAPPVPLAVGAFPQPVLVTTVGSSVNNKWLALA